MKYDTHVCLVSAQATPNLAPALDEQWRPRRVVLATSRDMADRAGYLERIFKRHAIATERLPIGDAYDYFQLYDTFFNFLDQQTAAVALNVTGGTKIMAMAAQEAFHDAGKSVFYVNVATDEVLVLGDRARGARLSEKLGLAEFLEAHGYTFTNDIRPAKPRITREQSDLTLRIVDGIERLGAALGELNAIAAAGALIGRLDERQLQSRPLIELIELFVEGGHIHRAGENLRFASDESRRFVGGSWLEHHVYKTVGDMAGFRHFADYGMNLKVTAPNGATLNEIDVAFLFRNTLHLIECKAANLANQGSSGDDKGTEAIYKLETLLKMGGLRTRGMLIDYRGRLAIARGKSDMKRVEANYARAEAAGIRIVSGSAIKTLKNEITQWIA